MDGRVRSNGGMVLTGKVKYWEKILFQCHLFYHKSHMGWIPGLRSGISATDRRRQAHYTVYRDREQNVLELEIPGPE